jgi:RNA polymerase sigma-70 factor (ECF subfamily)
LPEPAFPGDEESALIARATRGDERAFTQLYDRHADRVYRHIFYRVDRTEDAEDLTQQVFLLAWRGLKGYQPTRSPFIAWLLTIAHNTLVTFYRRQKTAFSLDAAEIDWPSPEEMEKGAEVRLDHERVRQAMRMLRADYQQVLALRFLEDLGHREIAGAIGKSEANVRVIQYRALHELRRILDGELK